MPHAASLKIPQPKVTATSYFEYVDHDFYGRDVRFLNWDKRKFTDSDWIRGTLKSTPEYAPMYVLPALAVWQRTKSLPTRDLSSKVFGRIAIACGKRSPRGRPPHQLCSTSRSMQRWRSRCCAKQRH